MYRRNVGRLFWLLWSVAIAIPLGHKTTSTSARTLVNRKMVLERFLQIGHFSLLLSLGSTSPALGWTSSSSTSNHLSQSTSLLSTADTTTSIQCRDNVADCPTINPSVAYQALELHMNEFGVSIPVACWFPIDNDAAASASVSKNSVNSVDSTNKVYYQHRISVRRIGQLLAGWNFIPNFVSKNYVLEPSSSTINVRMIHSSSASTPELIRKGPVIFLAHGYLGSRFDLSHLAEELAAEGFICIAAEYPESLAASYERVDGLDRSAINTEILQRINDGMEPWNVIQPTAYGIVGHSLGCGTVLQMGTEQWARVLIAGFPRSQDGIPIPGNNLFITSLNDGTVSLMQNGGPSIVSDCDFQLLSEQNLIVKLNEASPSLPRRSALIFDRPDAPNHISYLSEGVNEAMIEFLSPLLPVAKALSIPVLDFDKYKTSRDSAATAAIVHPLIIHYLKQEMSSQLKTNKRE
jgi:hypothetical protein